MILDYIEMKKNGQALDSEALTDLVQGFISGSIPSYQMSAFLMAVYFQGMTAKETADLTQALVDTGDILDLSSLKNTADKHSTGGVGDLTTLVVAPMAAAMGMTVCKMSGRGLGHTGGTVDKLESIPGFKVELSEEEMFNQAKEIGLVVAAQTGDLVPGDKAIYALRDVTATVDSIPLIASSIMSKKIASGAKNIVLDVKVGSGAFMKTKEEAEDLARTMEDIGQALGRKTRAILSPMDAPLGYAVGNRIEIAEAVRTLQGEGPDDIVNLSIVLASTMGELALGLGEDQARTLAKDILESGQALEMFKAMVERQGGNWNELEDLEAFTQANYYKDLLAKKSGVVSRIDALSVGKAALHLGAGREYLDSLIDDRAGVVLKVKLGDRVELGQTLAILQSSRDNFDRALGEIIIDIS